MDRKPHFLCLVQVSSTTRFSILSHPVHGEWQPHVLAHPCNKSLANCFFVTFGLGAGGRVLSTHN